MATFMNDYKKDFVLKRFLQTVVGGAKLKLSNRDVDRDHNHVPRYVYLNQVVLLVTPFLIGSMFTLLVELKAIANHVACYIYGSVIFLLVFIGQMLSYFKTRRSNDTIRLESLRHEGSSYRHVFFEEDQVNFGSCLGAEAVNFVLPVKKFKINILVHSLLSGPLCGVGLGYLLPSTLESLYGNVGATVVIFVFGWFTICVAQYSLTATSPPEPATFSSTDPYEVKPLMRPFYVYIFLALHLVHCYIDGDFALVNQILHVVFIFLPVLWSLAILPPLDALFPWLMEQCLVVVGGSPMAGDLRLILMFLASCVSFVAIFLLGTAESMTFTAAYVGYFLSLDHSSLVNRIITATRKNSTNQTASPEVHDGFGRRCVVKQIFFHLFMLAVICGVLLVAFFCEQESDVTHTVGYLVVGSTIVVKVLGGVQSVYSVFGVWRNYLFPHSLFKLAKYSKSKAQLLKVAVIRRIILNFVAPVLVLLYLSLSFLPDNSALPSFIFTLGIVRALRWVWQGTFNSMVEISIVHVINEVFTPTSGWWYDLGLGPQLLVVGLLWNRANRTVDMIFGYLTILITSHTYKTQRPEHYTLIVVLSVIFFPVVLSVILLAAFLSAPLLPLFTLPIMLLGFPRPLRSWPGEAGGSANTCEDTVYYRQLAPRLTAAFKNCCTSGSLGNLSVGAHFLARFQDRTIWLQVLECGYGYCCISVKGLELQETSCHTEEAAKIDDIFECSFEREGGFPALTFNQNLLHVFTPVDAIPVDTYSSAKTSLTGLIDSPDTLRRIGTNFWKTLTWVLLQHITHREKIMPSSRTTSPTVGHVEVKIINRGNSQTGAFDKKGKTFVDVNDEDSGRATAETSRHVTATSRNSLKSPASSWDGLDSWDDDDDDSLDGVPFGKRGNKIPLTNLSRGKTELMNIPGAIDTTDDEDDDVYKFKNGLPPVDVDRVNYFPNPLAKPVSIKLAGSGQFSSPHSSKLSLPLKWRDIPLESRHISGLLCDFPKDWYRHVIEHLDLPSDVSSSGAPSSDVVDEIVSDEVLTSIYTQLVSAIFSVVNVLGLSKVDYVMRGPMHVYKVFIGKILSEQADWLTQDEELFSLALQAYRYAVKLSFDEVVYGEASDNDEVREYLEDYEANWYMGLETDADWIESILQEKPNLFTIGCDASCTRSFTSHTLTKHPMMVSIGRLNAELVRGLWADLSLELFYFTNDDEERYSIQAHPSILRNLTVQAADPPLGYPIFFSKPSISTL